MTLCATTYEKSSTLKDKSRRNVCRVKRRAGDDSRKAILLLAIYPLSLSKEVMTYNGNYFNLNFRQSLKMIIFR